MSCDTLTPTNSSSVVLRGTLLLIYSDPVVVVVTHIGACFKYIFALMPHP